MKKLSYLLSAACAVLALTSCEAEKDPVYHAPTAGSFYLYAPAMQDQLIDLEQGGSDGTITITANGQPDYGYSAVATYSVKMSLTQDFSNAYDLIPVDPHQSVMQVKQFDIAQGICELLGLDSEEAYNMMYPDGMPPMAVNFMASCELAGIEGSQINSSNFVSYNYIKPYFAVAVPGKVYLVGNPNGWNINESKYVLSEAEDAIGSKIYSGSFELEAGSDIYFRFYTELGNWGDDGALPSVGPNAVDGDNTEVVVTDGSYTSPAVPGKGSWFFPSWDGGEVTMVLDMSQDDNWTFTFYTGVVEVFTPKYIYLMGSLTDPGWQTPDASEADFYANYKLANSQDTPNIYTGVFSFPAGDTYFRFFTDLTSTDGWDNPSQLGAKEENDDNLNISFTNGQYGGTYVMGKGCWVVTLDEPKSISLSVDMDQQQVSFVYVEDSEE